MEVDDRGFVVVDDHLRTSVDGVYAVGDVVATPQLAHVGFAEAIVIVKTMLGEPVTPIDYDKVPWGIYCHPEVAFCGLTEEQARERGHDVVVTGAPLRGRRPGADHRRDRRHGEDRRRADGAMLGVHIAGPWATELIAEGYLVGQLGGDAADLGVLIHPHPTLSELFGESALALTGRRLH